RTGQNQQETVLTPANVHQATFGKLFVMNVDGKVDAQPLYVPSITIPAQGVHNVLYVVTEHDSAYAFDADNGAQLWKVSARGSGETTSDDHGCGQVTPEIGMTATPAIDLQAGPHGTLYATAMTKDGSGHYHQRLHALDLTTGAEQFGGPMEVQATYAGNGAENTFLPGQHVERPGLLILNGVVYTSWGSHCDGGPYAGWVIGYNETTLAQVSVLNLLPNGSEGGIWAAGSGPATDSNGNIYLLTGNGTFDTTLTGAGFPNKSDYGNAFVKISTAGGGLAVTDYFTMSNTVSESGGDVDLGSGGLMLLPPLNDSLGTSRSLIVGAGKDSNVYILDKSNMGKFSPSTDAIYQQMSSALPGGAWSSPAWFNGTLYYGNQGQPIQAFHFANGFFQTPVSSHSAHSFTYPGATPSISANGISNAILWAVENTGTATLHAYDATNLATELYNSNQAAASRDHFGSGNKFIVPTVVNGKVYVGTTNGVGAFGLLCSYAIAPQSVTVPAGGATQSVSVVATNGCAWTASSNASFLSITSGASGSGSGSVSYQVAANSGATRSGTLTIAGQTFTVTESGTAAPTLNLSRTSLHFGYNGSLVTSPQTITVTFTGGSSIAWMASSNQPNITVSPGYASGNGTFQVTASAGASGVITVTAAGAANSPQQIQVNVASAAPGSPFGSFDTPANNTTGIAGAIPVTGWALDNVEVSNVGIWRDPIGGEAAAPNGLVFIGDAVFVPGARPDVETGYPNVPLNYRGGWGYLLLTNFLANSGGSLGPGNGTYNLHAIAVNAAGNTLDLGTRTITVDNAHAAKPFGTIDTPSQSGTISGNAFVNFGWALTQNPYSIPINGSTLSVIVDGVTLGHPAYNQYRSDIATLFPGLANSNGAVGFFYIDTTTLANGMHTISWVATDSAGHTDGLGSRYFTVLNSAGPIAAPEASLARPRVKLEREVQIQELDRITLDVGTDTGFLLVNGEQRPLPIGSTLRDGMFYWQPGPGFLGEYQLQFERPGQRAEQVIVNIQPRVATAPVQ
ncbi:MAG TPA: hypothetical protein VH157_03770, partial [Bryobacteraceae bacterium]|nr:hypothetical protein [Bryobacteraceae bacterium]